MWRRRLAEGRRQCSYLLQQLDAELHRTFAATEEAVVQSTDSKENESRQLRADHATLKEEHERLQQRSRQQAEQLTSLGDMLRNTELQLREARSERERELLHYAELAKKRDRDLGLLREANDNKQSQIQIHEERVRVLEEHLQETKRTSAGQVQALMDQIHELQNQIKQDQERSQRYSHELALNQSSKDAEVARLQAADGLHSRQVAALQRALTVVKQERDLLARQAAAADERSVALAEEVKRLREQLDTMRTRLSAAEADRAKLMKFMDSQA